MNKPSHRIETDDSGGESHALYFAPWFKWGLPVIVLLCFLMALVSISFQQDRLAMTLLHQHLPEIATAVDVTNEPPGPTKFPAPGEPSNFWQLWRTGTCAFFMEQNLNRCSPLHRFMNCPTPA
jgi:hypothetical protein